MKSKLPLIIGVILVIALAIGVGVAINNKNSSDKPASTTSTATPATTPSSGSSSSSSSANNSSSTTGGKVTISGFAFAPSSLSVKVGDTVTWTNNDSVEHDVVVDSGDGPHSQLLAQGKSYSFTFKTAGTFAYHCSVHPDMTATIKVTQ